MGAARKGRRARLALLHRCAVPLPMEWGGDAGRAGTTARRELDAGPDGGGADDVRGVRVRGSAVAEDQGTAGVVAVFGGVTKRGLTQSDGYPL